MKAQEDKIKTPNKNCSACQNNRIHNSDEWKKYHPDAGTGVDNRNNSIKKNNENKQ